MISAGGSAPSAFSSLYIRYFHFWFSVGHFRFIFNPALSFQLFCQLVSFRFLSVLFICYFHFCFPRFTYPGTVSIFLSFQLLYHLLHFLQGASLIALSSACQLIALFSACQFMMWYFRLFFRQEKKNIRLEKSYRNNRYKPRRSFILS